MSVGVLRAQIIDLVCVRTRPPPRLFRAQSLAQLAEDLPDLGTGKISLLLETLVSRRFLRPFIVDDEMFWRMTAPAAQ